MRMEEATSSSKEAARHRLRRGRLRFSLRSLVLLLLLLASMPVLWMHWDAWVRVKDLGTHLRGEAFLHSPDGTMLLGTFDAGDRREKVYDAHSGNLLAALEGTFTVWNFTFTPDSKWILGVQENSSVGIWSATTGKQAGELSFSGAESEPAQRNPDGLPIEYARIIKVSPDSRQVAVAVPGQGVWVWLLAEPTLKIKIPAPVAANGMGALAFSSDGMRLVVGGERTSATVWEVESGRPLGELSGQRNQVRIAKFSDDGSKILTYNSSSGVVRGNDVPSTWDIHEIQIWDARTFKVLNVMFGHSGYDVDFSADGEDLVIKEYGGATVQWHAQHPGWWWGVAWLPEFWLALFLAPALLWSLWRDRKVLKAAEGKVAFLG